MFIDGHKRFNIIKNSTNFLKVIKDLKPYMVEIEEDETIKAKVYLDDYIVEG